MSNRDGVKRREFIKMAGLTGLAGLSFPLPKVIEKGGDDDILVSPEHYGGFQVRRSSRDNPFYRVEDSTYARFDEKNQMFSRALWERETMEMERKYAGTRFEHIKNNDPGFTRLDYAFSTMAWFAHDTQSFYKWTSLRRNPLGRWDPSLFSLKELTAIIKKVALFYGASLVGIAERDERWFYSNAFVRGNRSDTYRNGVGNEDDPSRDNLSIPISFEDVDEPVKNIKDRKFLIPKSMKFMIALAIEMDGDGVEYGTNCLAGAATGNGYSRMAVTAGTLAEFIRALGYRAIPMGNDTALSIPVAVDAGLGELGRHGLLITPKYGPRVRLCKVLTDLPLVPDKPIRFGVTEFCETCKKCARLCPSNAIPDGPRAYQGRDMSNNPGVLKWPVEMFKCYAFWNQNGINCSNCIAVCPFNKPESWIHDAARLLIGAKSGVLNKGILKLDDAGGYGLPKDPNAYWKKDHFIHIKS